MNSESGINIIILIREGIDEKWFDLFNYLPVNCFNIFKWDKCEINNNDNIW